MRRELRFILACVLICLVSLWIGTSYFYRAFPEASIDFRVDHLSSKPLAERLLASQGLDPSGYLHASAFQYDTQAKVFIERELGLEKANALMKNQVKLWRWGHRWFKPKQKEEFRAEISTSGEVASFSHVLPENAPGADLQADVARLVAHYNLFAVPVVDEEGHLLGIVTMDDAIDAVIPTSWKKRIPKAFAKR